jgi:hypothetical protein
MRTGICIALIAAHAAWGSNCLAIRFPVKTIPSFLTAGSRFLVPSLILCVWRKTATFVKARLGQEAVAPSIIFVAPIIIGSVAVMDPAQQMMIPQDEGSATSPVKQEQQWTHCVPCP